MKRCIGFVFLIFAISLFAVTTGGTLRFVVGADAVTLLPGNFSDGASALVSTHIFEGLVELDENNQIQPLLAEKWEVSPKADVYTFYLRKGVKFQDGTDFTAAAVKKHFDFLLANKFRRSGMFRAVVKEVKVINDYTVQFILHEPFAPFLYYLAHEAAMIPSPVSIDKYGKDPATLGKNPVGTGPFILQEWKVGERIVLRKNPNYWQKGKPYLDSIIFQVIPDDVSRVTAVRSGSAHIMFNPPPVMADVLKKDKSLNVNVRPGMRVIYIGINLLSDKFKDVRVRQALNYAIDKQKLCEVIMRGYAFPSDSPLSPLVPGYFPVGVYEYNPEKAKQLLKEAGVTNLKVELATPKGRYLNDYETALAVQSMLKAVGIQADVKPMEWGTFLDYTYDTAAKFELFLIGWSPSTGEGHWVLYPLFHSDNALKNPDGTGDNNGSYINKKVDELIEKIASEPDWNKAKEYYKQVQQIIKEDAPWIFLYVPSDITVVRKEVKGVNFRPLHVKFAYIEK